MQAEGRHYRDIASAILSRPDEVMLEVGAGGELLVARLRVVIAAMLLLLPLANAATGGQFNETLIGLAGAVFVNLFAQVWLALARQKRRYRWLPYGSGAFDVTATTIVLVMLAANHLPAGLNSMRTTGSPLNNSGRTSRSGSVLSAAPASKAARRWPGGAMAAAIAPPTKRWVNESIPQFATSEAQDAQFRPGPCTMPAHPFIRIKGYKQR